MIGLRPNLWGWRPLLWEILDPPLVGTGEGVIVLKCIFCPSVDRERGGGRVQSVQAAPVWGRGAGCQSGQDTHPPKRHCFTSCVQPPDVIFFLPSFCTKQFPYFPQLFADFFSFQLLEPSNIDKNKRHTRRIFCENYSPIKSNHLLKPINTNQPA